MNAIFPVGAAAVGWGVGYFFGGTHDWGWRVAVLFTLIGGVVAIHLQTELTSDIVAFIGRQK